MFSRTHPVFFIALASFLCVSGAGHAQTAKPIVLDIQNTDFDHLKSELNFCGSEPDSRVRLSCYESAAKAMGLTTYSKKNEDTTNRWVTKNNPKADDWIAAVQALEAPANGDKKTVMVLRCTSGKMSFYLQYGSTVGATPLTVDVGMSPESMGIYSFIPSGAKDALGLWDDGKARTMAGYIAQLPGEVYVRTHFPDSIQTDHFSITGISESLTDVRRACHW